MKKRKRILIFMMSLIILSTILTACGKDDKKQDIIINSGDELDDKTKIEEKRKFTVGCMPLNEPAVQIMKELLEPKGYDLEITVFDGNHLPAVALKEGNIDSLILNHLPWINTFNEENNTDLTMVEPYVYYSYFAIYSSKYKSIDELPKNAQIAIAGDPTNMDRSLRVLRDTGLITLGEKTGSFYSLLDIEDNPKNIKLIETETTATVRSIEDVDAIITFSSTMKMAGFDPKVYLYEDESSTQFPTGLVVQPENVDEEWVKAIIEVTQTDEFKDKFNEFYGGAYKLFND